MKTIKEVLKQLWRERIEQAAKTENSPELAVFERYEGISRERIRQCVKSPKLMEETIEALYQRHSNEEGLK